jgi:hypothetical protein
MRQQFEPASAIVMALIENNDLTMVVQVPMLHLCAAAIDWATAAR